MPDWRVPLVKEKSTIMALMCACLVLSLVGVFSNHWMVIENVDREGRSSLRAQEVEYLNGTYEDWSEAYAESMNTTCSLAEEYRIELENGEVFWPDEEWVLMWEEFCEEYTILTYSGYTATGLLSLSSIVSLFFLIQTGRQIRRDVNLFSFVEFDFRIVVLSGGLTTITPIFWRVSNHGVISDSEVLTLSWGFYLTVLGGLLGLIAFGLLYRSDDLGGGLERIKENRKLTKEAAIAHKEMMMREYAEQKKADEEANLLHVTEAAVRAKINAENNPKDPLGWLLMAEAMEKANRHEEALRGRRIAMDLMEKQEEE
tara:strand:+ start:110 stop:1051 length:942 start_codon:yes stop_codon:yes gene_type:complete